MEYFLDLKKENEDLKLNNIHQEKNYPLNNIIKNLNYEILINKNNEYKINSEKSEITYAEGVEMVLMKNVKATLTDRQKNSIFIKADNALYNNNNFNTSFENNVRIEYLNNLITSKKMILNFQENYILILDQVKYQGLEGELEADNIKFDLITKKIKIFMSESNKSVLVKSTR